MQDPVKAKAMSPRTPLCLVQIAFALIVLGTSAAVINDWPCGNTVFGTFCLYDQGKVNIALFTAIIAFLGNGVLAFAHFTGKGEDKVIVLIELIIFVLLWIFWFTSSITTSTIVGSWSSTLQACCAFCWLSWLLCSASVAFVVMAALKGGAFKSKKAAPQSAVPPSDAEPASSAQV